MALAYKIIIQPVDPHHLFGQVAPTANRVPEGSVTLVCPASAAQIVAIQDYVGEISAGTDTSSVEAAIDAL
jgi:hypothetical protein